jgi:hypothetical protein
MSNFCRSGRGRICSSALGAGLLAETVAVDFGLVAILYVDMEQIAEASLAFGGRGEYLQLKYAAVLGLLLIEQPYGALSGRGGLDFELLVVVAAYRKLFFEWLIRPGISHENDLGGDGESGQDGQCRYFHLLQITLDAVFDHNFALLARRTITYRITAASAITHSQILRLGLPFA